MFPAMSTQCIEHPQTHTCIARTQIVSWQPRDCSHCQHRDSQSCATGKQAQSSWPTSTIACASHVRVWGCALLKVCKGFSKSCGCGKGSRDRRSGGLRSCDQAGVDGLRWSTMVYDGPRLNLATSNTDGARIEWLYVLQPRLWNDTNLQKQRHTCTRQHTNPQAAISRQSAGQHPDTFATAGSSRP